MMGMRLFSAKLTYSWQIFLFKVYYIKSFYYFFFRPVSSFQYFPCRNFQNLICWCFLVEWPVKVEVSIPARISTWTNHLDTVWVDTTLCGLTDSLHFESFVFPLGTGQYGVKHKFLMELKYRYFVDGLKLTYLVVFVSLLKWKVQPELCFIKTRASS